MKFNNYSRAVITGALKKSNQRLVQMTKSLGPDSAILSHQIAPFENGSYSKYMSTSKSGNIKFDIRQIMKDIESGAMDYSEANDFLAKAAGVRLSSNGEATHTNQGGIDTISETKKKAREMFGGLSDEEVLKKYEEVVSARDNFQYDYDAYMSEFGPAKAQNTTPINKLWRDGEALNYDDFIAIDQAMREELEAMKKKAFTYGGNK